MDALILQLMFFAGLPIVVTLWAWFITIELRRHRHQRLRARRAAPRR